MNKILTLEGQKYELVLLEGPDNGTYALKPIQDKQKLQTHLLHFWGKEGISETWLDLELELTDKTAKAVAEAIEELLKHITDNELGFEAQDNVDLMDAIEKARQSRE